jgi:hypothetical protein
MKVSKSGRQNYGIQLFNILGPIVVYLILGNIFFAILCFTYKFTVTGNPFEHV